MPHVIPAAKRAQILEALREPKAKVTRVARKFGVSDSFVIQLRREAGLAPLASADAKRRATEARDYAVVEARRKRAEIASMAADLAKATLRQMNAPAKVFAWGRNADGVHAYVEHRLARPDTKGLQALAITAGILIDKVVQIEKYDLESASGAKAAIMELVDTMRAQRKAEHSGEPSPPPEQPPVPA